MHDPQSKSYARWLKTDSGRAYKAKQIRYKKAALAIMWLESIKDELYTIASECEELEWAISDDETLLDVLDGDSEDIEEFRFMFADLSANCNRLHETLQDSYVTEHFDDFFVKILGDKYTVIGFDKYQEDYYGLTSYEQNWAQSESAKRLKRLTKDDLLSISGQCFGIALSIVDIRHTYDCLKSAFDLLKGDRVELLKNVKDIEAAYEAVENGADSYATNHFDNLLWRLPDKVWIA